MAASMGASTAEHSEADWVDARVDSMAASSADGTDIPTAEMLVATRVDSTDVVSAVLMVAWTAACICEK